MAEIHVRDDIARASATIRLKTAECTNPVKYPRPLQDGITWHTTWPTCFIVLLNHTGWQEASVGWHTHAQTLIVSSLNCLLWTHTHQHKCLHMQLHTHRCPWVQRGPVHGFRGGCAARRPIRGQRWDMLPCPRSCSCQLKKKISAHFVMLSKKGTQTHTHTNMWGSNCNTAAQKPVKFKV